jgi:biopolymer transport protein ExbD
LALGHLKNRTQQFSPPKLMLTSMMDMFTIILIFLLFSFSDTPEHHRLNKDLELPNSSTKINYQKAVEITLTKNELRLNDEVMARVDKEHIDTLLGEDLKTTGLYKRLKALRDEIGLLSEGGAKKKTEQVPHILFLCDKSYSFKTINKIIKTAGIAGYPNFQFAVLEGK